MTLEHAVAYARTVDLDTSRHRRATTVHRMRHTSPCVAERYGITSGRTRQGGIWFEGEGLRGGMITGQSQQKPLYTG